MAKFNAENERTKRHYFEWEKEARGKANATVSNIRDALYSFEESTGFKNFKAVTKEDIVNFKNQIKKKINHKTDRPVSETYLLHTSQYLISFFQWLCTQKGYKKLNATDFHYFKISGKDMQIARATPSKRYPSLEQIEHVVKNMPHSTELQKRDRALIAFLALSGMRVAAIVSLKLKHISLSQERIEQDPKEVKTKGSKKIVTYFFPVGDYLKQVVIDWVTFLKNEKLCDPGTPLFPSTKVSLNQNSQFSGAEFDTTPWKSTTPLRTIVENAFKAAGLDYYNPHAFRHTIVNLAHQVCRKPEDLKAWSQNMGHNSVLTTLTSYGTIDECNQGDIIKRLSRNDDNRPVTVNDLKKWFSDGNIKT